MPSSLEEENPAQPGAVKVVPRRAVPRSCFLSLFNDDTYCVPQWDLLIIDEFTLKCPWLMTSKSLFLSGILDFTVRHSPS